MEHENAYMLMMDALDGEFTVERERQLETHLHACPSCMREWQALLAIDMLFRQTPALSPAAGFTQRTLARLPNRQYRIWIIGIIYVLLLLGGALPLLIGVWAVSKLGPVLSQPSLARDLLQSLVKVLQVARIVLGALLNGLGEFVVQQPAVLGWLMVMAGLVFLWSGVYRQLVSQPSQVRSMGE
jgi:anti-sigma factor RsiW